MYTYRRMTPEQRAAVVAERIAHQRPWHKPHHPSDPGWYLITAACYEHCLRFQQPTELSMLQVQLHQAFEFSGCQCGGWVVLPNHYHALLRIDSFKTFGRAIGRVHGRTASFANQRDNVLGRRVWYKYSDRKVRSERHYWTCLHYILMNPVKHEFVKQIEDWEWSCYHQVLAEQGRQWIDDLRRDYPLHDFGKQWDDWQVETHSS